MERIEATIQSADLMPSWDDGETVEVILSEQTIKLRRLNVVYVQRVAPGCDDDGIGNIIPPQDKCYYSDGPGDVTHFFSPVFVMMTPDSADMADTTP